MQDRIARVERLKEAAARRLGQQGLAKGWSTWFGKHEVRKHNEQMLRAAGARLCKPKLAASMAHWRHDWESAGRAAKEKAAKDAMEQQKREIAEKRAALERDLWARWPNCSSITMPHDA